MKDGRERRAGGEVRFDYAVIDVLEWLRGDPQHVLQTYRKSFPLWSSPVPVNQSKSVSSEVRDPLLDLLGRVGQERLFLVDLPDDSHTAWGEPAPPAFILKRWGKFSVGFVRSLPADARGEIEATQQDVERRTAWIRKNAEDLVVEDRFQGNDAERVASAVWSLLGAEIEARAGARPKAGPAVVTESGAERVVRFDLTGSAELTGTLTVVVRAGSRRVRSFRLELPFVNAPSPSRPPLELGQVAPRLRELLGIRARGGLLADAVTQATAGLGASHYFVRLHPGFVYGDVVLQQARTLRARLTLDGLLFEYSNGWASAEPPSADADG